LLVLLGPSGVGKTILLNTLAGFQPALGGRIRLAGRELTTLPPEQRRIGMVFQDSALFPHLTVTDNIRFGPRARGEHNSAHELADLLHRFGLTALAQRSPGSLSGGERQRVALARALASKPELLLLDEPLSALDQPTRETLRDVLGELHAALDIPIVHVTHDRDEALTLADELAILTDGVLRQHGPPRRVTDQPADPDVARLVGWTELGTATVADQTASLATLRVPAPGQPDGPARIFYRPEDVILAPDGRSDQPGHFTTTIQQITPTVPLARVSLGPNPTLAALIYHRDLHRLDLHVGDTTVARIPPTAVRLWPTRNASTHD
jgi:ABC-type Fe3+/spermidine/putrescine transport system ATPase subunit